VQLYNLEDDLAEEENLAERQPERVKELTASLARIVEQGRSTPGEKQENATPVTILRAGRSN
jgi:hypothetical protein